MKQSLFTIGGTTTDKHFREWLTNLDMRFSLLTQNFSCDKVLVEIPIHVKRGHTQRFLLCDYIRKKFNHG